MKKWKSAGLLFLAATVTCCSTVYAASDYIIADSNSRYLSYEDVGSLSLQQVNYAKNEIFARRGRKFASTELQNYFNSQDWYTGIYEPADFDNNSAAYLNDYEIKNADFLASVEFSIDPNGYQLDAASEIPGTGDVTDVYAEVVADYADGVEVGLENVADLNNYVSTFFSPGYRQSSYDKVCYAYYDFAEDQLPELLISLYYEESDSYAIVDAFGTDGTNVSRLLEGDLTGGLPYGNYIFSENNMICAHWSTSGMSHAGEDIFELIPGAATAKHLFSIDYDGQGNCYRNDTEDLANSYSIQPSEYIEIRDSYQPLENVNFEWKDIEDYEESLEDEEEWDDEETWDDEEYSDDEDDDWDDEEYVGGDGGALNRIRNMTHY